MPTIGPGARQWTRGSEANRATGAHATDVLPYGEMVITNEGNVYFSDGVTAIKDLVRSVRLTELNTLATTVTNNFNTLTAADTTNFNALTVAINAVGGRTLLDVVPVNADGALVKGKHNPVDASSGSRSMTLDAPSAAGQLVAFSKSDSSVNTVTLTLNLRGTTNSTLPLYYQYEALLLVGKADGSWWPISGHRTKSSLDAVYLGVTAATPNKHVLRDANGRAQFGDPLVAADAATKNYTDTQDAATLATANSNAAALGTDAATASTIVRRDANSRAKVADPAVASDIATKGYADALGGSTSTASTIMRRDANGRASVADPSAATDISTKNYVDATAGVSTSTASTLMRRDASGRASVADPSASTDIATKNYIDATAGTAVATASALVRRDSSSRISVGTPTAVDHAVTKTYVDTGTNNTLVNAGITALAGKRAVAIAESIPRIGPAFASAALLTSGVEFGVRMGLVAGQIVTSVTWLSGTTALATGSNQWFTLRDANFNLLGITADDTSTAWAASSSKTLALTAQYTIPSTGGYYVGVMVNATTVPSLIGVATGATIARMIPLLSFSDNNTGKTTPSTATTTPVPVTTGTGTSTPYAYVS